MVLHNGNYVGSKIIRVEWKGRRYLPVENRSHHTGRKIKISSAGQATAIVLIVIVKAHSLEDERTLRDSHRGLSYSDLALSRVEPLKSS